MTEKEHNGLKIQDKIGLDKFNQKDYEGAIIAFDRVIELDPNNADAYAARGAAKGWLKDYKGAIADCDKAIAINPDCATAYHTQAVAKQKLGDNEGALADLHEARNINTKSTP